MGGIVASFRVNSKESEAAFHDLLFFLDAPAVRRPSNPPQERSTLDRLSRNQSFLVRVWEGTGKAGVVFCDLPSIPAGPVGKFIVQQMAAVAEFERGLISSRTKAALVIAKEERGMKLGGFRGHVVDGRLGAAANRKAADAFAADLGQ